MAGALIAGLIGLGIVRYQHRLDVKSAEEAADRTQEHQLRMACSSVLNRHHTLFPSMITPPLPALGVIEERREKWLLDRPRTTTLLDDLVAIASVANDDELVEQAIELWRLWTDLVTHSDALCWAVHNRDLTQAAAGYESAFADIPNRFESFSSACEAANQLSGTGIYT